MKKTYIIAMISGMAIMVASCGNSSCSGSGYTTNDDWSSSESDDYDYSNSQQTQMVSCPMCGGTGVFDFMPGDMFAPKYQCPACEGNGVCSARKAQEAIQAKREADAMMSGGCSNGSGYYDGEGYGSGRSAYEIEYDLQKARELLEEMEENYYNCSSGVIRAQYPSMIAEQRTRIAQLEAELRNAQ